MKEITPYAAVPSMITCDLCNLEAETKKFKKAGVEALHIDILDGNFSPSMPVGIDTYEQLKKKTDLKFDVHIMSINNEFFVKKAIEMRAERVCFQVEGERHIAKLLMDIKASGAKVGLAFAPATF